MPLYKDPKSSLWYASIYVNGRRLRRCTGTSDRKKAQRIHDELKADQWSEVRQSETASWLDACAAWLSAEPRSKSDRYSIRKLNTTFENCALADLVPTSFFPHLSPVTGTFNRYAAIINAILNLAKEHGNLDKPPLIKMKKAADGRIYWLTKEEWERLYIQLPEHLKPMAKFSIATGLRQSNVTQLKWSQVDMKRKVMWVHADEAKGKKPIGLPLADDAMEVLRNQVGLDKTFVFTYRGKPITKIKNAWQNAIERAGIGEVVYTTDENEKKHRKFTSNFCWHAPRHTWATWHLQAGTPLPELQKLGGWAERDMGMVMKYAHFAPEHLAGYANNAKPYSPITQNAEQN